MKVCIIGNGLISLTLSRALVNIGISVDVYYNRKVKNQNLSRTLGISATNVQYFNKHIINIDQIRWEINNIKIYTEKFLKDEFLNFSNTNKHLFSILANYKLYNLLDLSLKKNKLFRYKKNSDLKKIIKQNYNLIINSEFNHEITKKYFSNMIKKKYNSFAFITCINHKKLQSNNIAIQIFTNNGPIAFLPISSTRTSVVYSYKMKDKKKIDILNLIKKFNPKYEIQSIENLASFELESSNLRKYYKGNVLAFGDLLHKLHPLAGQGFNMSVRDVKELILIIKKRINLGLDLDSQICLEFQKKTKDKNYIFSSGIDFLYEFFNLENKIKNNFISKSINIAGKNRIVKKIFQNFADRGF